MVEMYIPSDTTKCIRNYRVRQKKVDFGRLFYSTREKYKACTP